MYEKLHKNNELNCY